jgi:PIN domain nuclease of toxin-antitoxin system
MMKVLLDTHTFLWINNDVAQLSEAVKMLCASGEHDFYLSLASPWEIQIKNQLGKLTLAISVEELVNKNEQENNIKLLPITLSHISYLAQLPRHHNDPFDRIIIAQAIIEGMTVATVDHTFTEYPVKVFW